METFAMKIVLGEIIFIHAYWKMSYIPLTERILNFLTSSSAVFQCKQELQEQSGNASLP
jgi:hypothetical protein